MAKAPAAKKEATDVLDNLADGDPFKALALVLWKDRQRNPDMSVTITRTDIKGFTDCVDYLKASPEVRVFRPQGRSAQAAIPERHGKPARAAIPAEPPRDFVVIQLVDKDGNAIKPVENNEEDFQRNILAEKQRKAREQADNLCTLLRAEIASGDINKSTIDGVCEALTVLARG